jgi:membrane-associated phospholipid phosphatase
VIVLESEGWSRFPFLHALPRSLARALTLPGAPFHALSVLATFALVRSGVDDRARDVLWAANPFTDSMARFACLYLGMLWPIAAGLLLFRAGFTRSDKRLTAAGCGVLQTIIVVGALVFVLKLATGRPQPEAGGPASSFNLLAFEMKRVWVMWPSGHTAETVSAAACLHAFFGPRRGVALAWLGAAAIASLMLVGCFHWVSDVVAAALIAFPFGWSIGRAFRAWAGEPAPAKVS